MADKISINNPGKLPVIIFSCGRYKQMVINPDQTVEIELGQSKLISSEEQGSYYKELDGFQGLDISVNKGEDNNYTATIVNNKDLPVIIFECGTYKQMIIKSKDTTTLSLTGRSVTSPEEEKAYYMNLNGYQGLVIEEVEETTGSIKVTVLKAEDDSPIQGATITGTGVTFEATGSDGTSTATGVAAGNVTLTIAASGYTSKEQEVTVTAGETTEQTVKLTVSA